MIGDTIVTDPTDQQPGFDLPVHAWSLVNHFQTVQATCLANVHKFVLPKSVVCECSKQQILNLNHLHGET